MGRIGISVYALHVYDKNGQPLELHNIVNGKGIIDLTKELILQNINSYVDVDEKESIFKFVDWEVHNINTSDENELYSLLYGRLKTGEYGVESEIVNKNTGKVTHRVSTDEAKVLPFDFCISVGSGTGEDGNHRGVVILQTNGVYGIKTVFENRLKQYIQSIDHTLVLNFGMIYPKTYLNNFIKNGKLKKIELYKYDIPNDTANRVGMNNGSKRSKQILTIVNPIGFLQRKAIQLKECIDGQRLYSSIIEIPDFDYDDLKLEFSLGNNTKKFSLKNLDKVVISNDITESVILNGGNPVKDSIIPILFDTSTEYLTEMGLLEEVQEELSATLIESHENNHE